MDYDLKTMYIVRGKLILAAFDLAKSRDNRDTVKILWKAIDIIEKKIFDKELPNKIEQYKNLFIEQKGVQYESSYQIKRI